MGIAAPSGVTGLGRAEQGWLLWATGNMAACVSSVRICVCAVLGEVVPSLGKGLCAHGCAVVVECACGYLLRGLVWCV